MYQPFRAASSYVERSYHRQHGGSKGVKYDPLSWRSRNQEVPCVLFVKLSSHKKVSAGVGRVAPQIGSAGTALQKTLQKFRRRSAAPFHACADKRNGLTECTGAGLGTTLQKAPAGELLQQKGKHEKGGEIPLLFNRMDICHPRRCAASSRGRLHLRC